MKRRRGLPAGRWHIEMKPDRGATPRRTMKRARRYGEERAPMRKKTMVEQYDGCPSGG